MNRKIKKYLDEIEKTEKKIADLEMYLKGVRSALKEEENNEMIKSIRGMKLKGQELFDLLNGIQDGTISFVASGKLIIPTYINGDAGTNKLAVKFLEKLGANFKRQFDAKTYEKFFADMGYEKVSYEIVRGRLSCDVAVIEVKKVMKKKLPPVLETERLILRPLTMADKNEIFKWTGDPRVAKFMLYPTYKSPDDADFWLENIYKNDGELDYGFVWKETGELIGSGGLNYDEKSGNWKLGYNMRFDMWGKGIATEVSRKVIEYAREKYKGNKIIGFCWI